MKIHFISTGGAIMHNLAIALHNLGHEITGSDDEIYNPAKARLAKYGLLPKKIGWDEARISNDIDCIILGMHARANNPELLKAQEFNLPIYSFPEYIYNESKKKKRVVVTGSHGKTTTTSMIMHVLKENNIRFDYLVGAQLEGFETMVQLSDAPIIVLEGDEYLSSPIDRQPKIFHYKPDITIITGIEWDHMNVFPTFENYLSQFIKYIPTIQKGGTLIYNANDLNIKKIIAQAREIDLIPYSSFPSVIKNGKTYIFDSKKEKFLIRVFGQHNLENLRAAYLTCKKLGVSERGFFDSISSFNGAAKRFDLILKTEDSVAYRDFAHAPSKVRAATNAMKEQYPDRELVACVELHSFSSLNKYFLPQYKNALEKADTGYVFFSQHTLKMKKLPTLSKQDIQFFFNHKNLKVFNHKSKLHETLKSHKWKNKNLLMMSSGTYDKTNFKELAKILFTNK